MSKVNGDRREEGVLEFTDTNAAHVVDEDASKSMNDNDQHQATFWSDEHGNLKFVNLVVRYPCCIFCSQIFVLIAITFLLMIMVPGLGLFLWGIVSW